MRGVNAVYCKRAGGLEHGQRTVCVGQRQAVERVLLPCAGHRRDEHTFPGCFHDDGGLRGDGQRVHDGGSVGRICGLQQHRTFGRPCIQRTGRIFRQLDRIIARDRGKGSGGNGIAHVIRDRGQRHGLCLRSAQDTGGALVPAAVSCQQGGDDGDEQHAYGEKRRGQCNAAAGQRFEKFA